MLQYPPSYPPTPTPAPPGAPYFEAVSDAWGLWGATSPAIQFWYSYKDGVGLMVQIVVLVVLIVAGVYVLARFILDFSRRDSNE